MHLTDDTDMKRNDRFRQTSMRLPVCVRKESLLSTQDKIRPTQPYIFIVPRVLTLVRLTRPAHLS